MAGKYEKAATTRLTAQSLRVMAAAEPNREVASEILSVAGDMENHAAELEKRLSASPSRRSLSS